MTSNKQKNKLGGQSGAFLLTAKTTEVEFLLQKSNYVRLLFEQKLKRGQVVSKNSAKLSFWFASIKTTKKRTNTKATTKEKKNSNKNKCLLRKLLLFGSISQPVISTHCSLSFWFQRTDLFCFFFQIFLFWQKFLHFWPGSWSIINNFPWKQTEHFL